MVVEIAYLPSGGSPGKVFQQNERSPQAVLVGDLVYLRYDRAFTLGDETISRCYNAYTNQPDIVKDPFIRSCSFRSFWGREERRGCCRFP